MMLKIDDIQVDSLIFAHFYLDYYKKKEECYKFKWYSIWEPRALYM